MSSGHRRTPADSVQRTSHRTNGRSLAAAHDAARYTAAMNRSESRVLRGARTPGRRHPRMASGLLALLANGAELSGSAAAAELGVTRAAVWKQIEQLRAHGLPIRAEAGRGYRLDAPIELLDRARIESAIPPHLHARVGEIEVLLADRLDQQRARATCRDVTVAARVSCRNPDERPRTARTRVADAARRRSCAVILARFRLWHGGVVRTEPRRRHRRVAHFFGRGRFGRCAQVAERRRRATDASSVASSSNSAATR